MEIRRKHLPALLSFAVITLVLIYRDSPGFGHSVGPLAALTGFVLLGILLPFTAHKLRDTVTQLFVTVYLIMTTITPVTRGQFPSRSFFGTGMSAWLFWTVIAVILLRILYFYVSKTRVPIREGRPLDRYFLYGMLALVLLFLFLPLLFGPFTVENSACENRYNGTCVTDNSCPGNTVNRPGNACPEEYKCCIPLQ